MVFQEIVAVLCFLQQTLVLQQCICVGEEPGDPAVQDTAFFRLFIQIQIVVQKTVITAELVIPHPFPERNDSFGQMLFDLFSHFLCFRIFHVPHSPLY